MSADARVEFVMDAEERARWEKFRREAVTSARNLREIDRLYADGKLPEAIHDQLLEAADLLDIFGRPIVVLNPTHETALTLTRRVIDRVMSVYREDYIERMDREEPESLLGLVKQLERALEASSEGPVS